MCAKVKHLKHNLNTKSRQCQRERSPSKSWIIYCFSFLNLKRSLIMQFAHLTFARADFSINQNTGIQKGYCVISRIILRFIYENCCILDLLNSPITLFTVFSYGLIFVLSTTNHNSVLLDMIIYLPLITYFEVRYALGATLTFHLFPTELEHFKELPAIAVVFTERFGERVVALNHAVEWPPRSPDLTPL